jgi:hypothetical protein
MKSLKLLLILFLFLLPFFSLALGSQRIYFLELEYDKGSLKLLDIKVVTGFPNLTQNRETLSGLYPVYKAEVFSEEEELFYQGYFEVATIVFPAPPQPGEEPEGPAMLETVDSTIVFLPYYKLGRTIRITKDNQEVLSIDVSKFQMYCGDGICQGDENYQICSLDCPVPTEGPPTPPGGEKTGGEKKPFNYLLYGGIIIAIIIIVFLIIKFKKKPENGGSI